jgi:hypothetical protein
MPGTYTEVPYCKKATSKEVSSTRMFNKHRIYKISLQNRLLGPGTYCFDTGDFSERAVWAKARGPNWEWAFQLVRLSAIPHALFRREWEQRKHVRRLLISTVCMCVLMMPLASRAAGPWEVQQWRIRGGTLAKTRQQPRGLSVQRFPLSPGKQSTASPTFQCFGGATLAI